MTDEHKAALAMGRNEGNAVRNYLEALRTNKPKRGRRRTRESIAARLAAIDTELASADPMNELRLRQERRDLLAELASMGEKVDISALENGFVAVGKSYSARQGIFYATWREIGVDAAVLKRAGISRSD
jgi:putative heme degradation protein